MGLWLVLLLTACGGPGEGGRFEIERVDSRWANGTLEVNLEQSLELSREARNALDHGVALTVEVELILRNAGSQTRVGNGLWSYEIRYLPLSQYYQVTELDREAVLTFPRLRHALAELSRLRLELETGALPAGDYELLARSNLDKNRMPPPMRLPATFSARWLHESTWTAWPMAIHPPG
ncbi:MAG: DUF4390 domain-containing protein [Xanthomonadales bacterium]|nr:DUF4390 domain-containing protein [Gammaproteobacteria bacterium]MBT8064800.1 DUF4390 domain-containing protein [Gammaproteobacteria bacterium]NNJ64114.1 DUF4390 domain-containing protein [Xanthomonadales bacterium]NNK37135.1 DUF4390 domain-containing protein [Xanthomonadales bacterium]